MATVTNFVDVRPLDKGEDRAISITIEDVTIHFVCDGHSGHYASEWLIDPVNLCVPLSTEINATEDIDEIPEIIRRHILTADDNLCEYLREVGSLRCGSTLTGVLILKRPDIEPLMWMINVGDSRCLVRTADGEYISSRAHTLSDDEEKDYIHSCDEGRRFLELGGFFKLGSGLKILNETDATMLRPEIYAFTSSNCLAMTRAMGHAPEKERGILSREPDITRISISEGITQIIMGSDGVFDMCWDDTNVWTAIDESGDEDKARVVTSWAEERWRRTWRYIWHGDCIDEATNIGAPDDITALYVNINVAEAAD